MEKKSNKPKLVAGSNIIAMSKLDEDNQVLVPDKVISQTEFMKGKTRFGYLIDPLKPRMAAAYGTNHIINYPLSKGGHIYLPSNIRGWLAVKKGDYIGFEIQINDKKQKFLILRKVIQEIDDMAGETENKAVQSGEENV